MPINNPVKVQVFKNTGKWDHEIVEVTSKPVWDGAGIIKETEKKHPLLKSSNYTIEIKDEADTMLNFRMVAKINR